jgi:hypothetical protein
MAAFVDDVLKKPDRRNDREAKPEDDIMHPRIVSRSARQGTRDRMS